MVRVFELHSNDNNYYLLLKVLNFKGKINFGILGTEKNLKIEKLDTFRKIKYT